jgi:hypothetical protein
MKKSDWWLSLVIFVMWAVLAFAVGFMQGCRMVQLGCRGLGQDLTALSSDEATQK